MNIIVCVKQTPEAGRGDVDRLSGTVMRAGSERQVINPFDLYAMEAALRLQEQDSSTRIIAVSMGPQSAGSVLRDCIALGADTGYLVTDPCFAGSDVRGTAHVLARAVRVIEKRENIHADAVFCGAKTVDGGTSMLGPELAVKLGVPMVTYALGCSLRRDGFSVEKEDDTGNRIYSIGTPCLMTFTKASFPVRYPAISRILEAESMELPSLSAADLDEETGLPAKDTRACESGVSSGNPEACESGVSAGNPEVCESAVSAGNPEARESGVSAGNPEACESETAAENRFSGGSGRWKKYAGFKGAALKVDHVRYRKLEKKSQIIGNQDPAQAAAELLQVLYSENVL